MGRSVYTLSKEPVEGQYIELVDYAATYCELALLVVRSPEDIDQGGLRLLERLEPFLHRREKSKSWPGTELLWDEADILYYTLHPFCVHLLKTAASRLYQWQHPQLPEDLCFLRVDEEPWLTSIAHEHDAFLTLSSEEFSILKVEAPGLAMVLSKDEGEAV